VSVRSSEPSSSLGCRVRLDLTQERWCDHKRLARIFAKNVLRVPVENGTHTSQEEADTLRKKGIGFGGRGGDSTLERSEDSTSKQRLRCMI